MTGLHLKLIKKIIIIMGLFSILGCNGNKIYIGDKNFIYHEEKLKINSREAYKIYLSTFNSNFSVKEAPFTKDSLYKVIYISEQNYFIGFASKNDKRDEKSAPLYFLAKVDSNTGVVTVIK